MKSLYKRKSTAAAALILIFVMLACTGCGAAKGSDGSPGVAKINDTVITQDQLDSFAKINMQLLGYDPSDITEDQQQELLDQMVVIEVVKEYYREKGEELYGDDYESAAETFVESAHESAEDFLTQYEITDEQLKDFYKGQYAVSQMFMEIQEENSSQDISALATEYYNENKEEFKNEDGTYAELDDVLQSVYYIIYSEWYDDRVSELKEDMDITIY